MPQSDRTTKVAKAVHARREMLATRIKEMSEVGFGKERLTKREFKSKVKRDPDFRAGMADEMGGEALARFMTENEASNGN